MTGGDLRGFGGDVGFDDLDDFFARPRPARSGRAATTTARRPAAPRAARPSRPDRPDRAGRPARPARAPRLARAPRPPRSRRGPVLADPRRDRRRTVGRLAGFVVAVVLVCAAITVRLADVQLGGAGCRTASVADCRAYGAGQRLTERELPAVRGTIFDQDGHPLALSVPVSDVVADPSIVVDPAVAARELAGVLDVAEDELLAKLADADDRYVQLALSVSPEVADDVRALDLDGILFEDHHARANPNEDLAQAVVGKTLPNGWTSKDNGYAGVGGIEYDFEEQLRGTAGTLTYEQDPQGGKIAGTSEKLVAAEPGADLYLTLDQSLQYEAEEAVARQVAATGAKRGMAVITRPSTGEVLAMVSMAADEDGTVAPTTSNDPVTAVFEPGSVNKMITVAGAMEEGLVDPDTTLDVPDHLQVSNHLFTDHDPHPTQPWSTTDILVTSSNVGTIKIAQQLGEARVDEYLRRFGFGSVTGPAFLGEEKGLLLPLDDWSGTSIGAIPIGQGLSVTALQMLAAYNVIANDGVYVAPKLVAGIDRGDGRVATAAAAQRRVVSEETARGMSGMLQKVVAEGTGEPAQVPGYPVAGKTGTARIPQPKPHLDPDDAYQDAEGDYHYESSFVGFVPGADLSIIVTIQDAQTSIYGSEVAAPVFARLAATALQREQVPPPSLVDAAPVPELSASAKEIRGEDPGLVTETTQG